MLHTPLDVNEPNSRAFSHSGWNTPKICFLNTSTASSANGNLCTCNFFLTFGKSHISRIYGKWTTNLTFWVLKMWQFNCLNGEWTVFFLLSSSHLFQKCFQWLLDLVHFVLPTWLICFIIWSCFVTCCPYIKNFIFCS